MVGADEGPCDRGLQVEALASRTDLAVWFMAPGHHGVGMATPDASPFQPRSKADRQANAHTKGEGARWASELMRRG